MDVARWEREEICVEKGFDGKMQTGVSELRMEILIYDVRWEIEIGDLKWVALPWNFGVAKVGRKF